MRDAGPPGPTLVTTSIAWCCHHHVSLYGWYWCDNELCFLQMWRLTSTPESFFIFVSSDQIILFLMMWKSFRCLLANSTWAALWLLLRSGFHQVSLPCRSHRWIAAEILVLLEGTPLSKEKCWREVLSL